MKIGYSEYQILCFFSQVVELISTIHFLFIVQAERQFFLAVSGNVLKTV